MLAVREIEVTRVKTNKSKKKKLKKLKKWLQCLKMEEDKNMKKKILRGSVFNGKSCVLCQTTN